MNLILRSPSQIVNPLARDRRFGFGSGVQGGAFVGALDAYTTGLVSVYSPFMRLLTSHTGFGVRVRRSSDSTLQDIGFKADGTFDTVSYAAFVGGGNGFAHTVYDQSGNSRNQVQSTAAAQPQIGVDGNGQYYLYAPGAGSATTNMGVVGLSIPASEFTMWSVAGASGVWFTPLCLRDNTVVKERAVYHSGTGLVAVLQDNATGSVPATITLTSGLVYSTVFAAGASNSRMTNRLTTNTGTRIASALNIEQMFIGKISGGVSWLQNAPFYMGAVWNVDQSTANFNALATLGKTLITTAQ